MEASTSRVIICKVSGVEIPYKGYGRPPLYSAAVKAERQRERRAARYAAKREAEGKSYKPRSRAA